jgi:glycogen operon protein
MLVMGDELSRTQQGNNNAYCQDNKLSWVDWIHADNKLLSFTKKIIEFRKNHPTFSRRRWFQGRPIKGMDLEDIIWFLPDGSGMSEEHWNNSYAKSLAVFLNGRGIHTRGPKGELILDDSFYIIFNAYYDSLLYKLPSEKYGSQWTKIIDTFESRAGEEDGTFAPNEEVLIQGRSIVVYKNPIFK